MTDEEIKDLYRYFRLDAYRDDPDYEGILLEDEYYELEELTKKYPIINALENARYLPIRGKITEEEYHQMQWKLFDQLTEAVKEDENKKTR